MQLTDRQRDLLARVTDTLEQNSRATELDTTKVPPELLAQLIGNDLEDVILVGLHVQSLLSPAYPLNALLRSKQFAHNYARYIVANSLASVPAARLDDRTRRLEQQWQHFPELLGAVNTFLQAWSQQTPMVAGPPSATGGPSAVPTVIVHGTYAVNQTWWQQGTGNFWAYINSKVPNLCGGPSAFAWSGLNDHMERVRAARTLVTWAGNQTLDVIAHSHGGNVCFLASRMGLKIRKLITLGTPIRTEYPPDVRHIEIIHNVYSTHDHVQTPAGTVPNRRGEGRSLGDAANVINHRAYDDGHGGAPGHTDLHEKDTWIASGLDPLL
ncbi:MAG: hypothetical protein KGL31_02360 [candidate division NC10 bacterium]|nr:hypothetical protein [candidate division NC10 bacterium]